MKKLAFLPLLFMLLFAGCGNEKEVVKPAETTENNLRGPLCPAQGAYFSDADEVLESRFACFDSQLQACFMATPITFYNHPTNLGTTIWQPYGEVSKYYTYSAAELDAIYNEAIQIAETNKPPMQPANCNGVVRYTLDFTALTCGTCPNGSLRVKVTYYCCEF